MNQGPYISPMPGEPPAGMDKPPVVLWYQIYCIGLAVLYVSVLGFMVVMGVIAARGASMKPEDLIVSGVVAVMCVPFAVFYAAAPFLPNKPWAWTYGIVAIAIGMTSACCLPACVPLLIYWMKPETKMFFGRNP